MRGVFGKSPEKLKPELESEAGEEDLGVKLTVLR